LYFVRFRGLSDSSRLSKMQSLALPSSRSWGMPNYYVGKCRVIHFAEKNCAVEYVDSHPFAPIVPEYYIVSFSSDDRVMEADQWDSP